MNPRAQVSLLPDGRRLHLHDGPIDLIIEAFGAPSQVAKAYSAATERFTIILDELCAELPLLRQTAGLSGPPVTGVVAKRMLEAVLPYAADNFITPMAAVAGSAETPAPHSCSAERCGAAESDLEPRTLHVCSVLPLHLEKPGADGLLLLGWRHRVHDRRSFR